MRSDLRFDRQKLWLLKYQLQEVLDFAANKKPPPPSLLNALRESRDACTLALHADWALAQREQREAAAAADRAST